MHALGVEVIGGRHHLKVLHLVDDGCVGLHGEGDHLIVLGDVLEGKLVELSVPCVQVGLGEVGDRCHACRAGEGIAAAVLSRVFGPHQVIIHTVGVAIHFIPLPHARVGRVHSSHHHAVSGQIAVPLAGLAVLDEEELVGGGCVEPVSRVATVNGLKGVGALGINQLRRGESQGVALIQAVTHRIAPEVVPAAASHDRPSARIAALASRAIVVGVIEVGQSQHVTELVTEGADAVDVGIVILPSGNLGRAGIEPEVHAVMGLVLPQVVHVGPQVALIVTAVVG